MQSRARAKTGAGLLSALAGLLCLAASVHSQTSPSTPSQSPAPAKSPSALGRKPGEPRTQSFIANNAIGEYEALANVSGDIDINGKLRATLAKNRALLEAAHAGTDVARRALILAVIEAYYGLALAIAERAGAEQNL